MWWHDLTSHYYITAVLIALAEATNIKASLCPLGSIALLLGDFAYNTTTIPPCMRFSSSHQDLENNADSYYDGLITRNCLWHGSWAEINQAASTLVHRGTMPGIIYHSGVHAKRHSLFARLQPLLAPGTIHRASHSISLFKKCAPITDRFSFIHIYVPAKATSNSGRLACIHCHSRWWAIKSYALRRPAEPAVRLRRLAKPMSYHGLSAADTLKSGVFPAH